MSLYFAIFYLGPAVLTFLFGAPLDQVLIASPNYLLGLCLASAVFALLYWAVGLVRMPRLAALYPLARTLFDDWMILGVSLLFLYLSYNFWQNLGLSYRQTGSRIGDTGFQVIVLYVLQNYLIAALVLFVGRANADLRRNLWVIGAILLAIIAGFFFSLQASSNVIVIAIALLVLARLVTGRELMRPIEGRSTIPTYLSLGVVAVIALFIGIANKRGVDETVYLLFNNFEEIIRIFQTRISYHFYGASFYTSYHFTDLELGWRAVEEVSLNVSHRIDVLLGAPTTFNDITSVKRLNYEMIAYYFRERTGTAPGMIAGLFFVPFGIFALPLTLLIYSFALRIVAGAIVNKQLSLFEIAFATMVMAGIVDASIDLLNIFDTPFTKLFFVVFAYVYAANAVPAASAADLPDNAYAVPLRS